jgi:hypothetical protein
VKEGKEEERRNQKNKRKQKGGDGNQWAPELAALLSLLTPLTL